jgi:putative transposase
VSGRIESRTLTHKGIEFEGLFYNSPELTELRRKEGANLAVEIRINESDIGSIYVLSPKT